MTPSNDRDNTTGGDEESPNLNLSTINDSMERDDSVSHSAGALSWRPPTPPVSPGSASEDVHEASSIYRNRSNNNKRWRLPSLFRNEDDEEYTSNDGPDESLLLRDESMPPEAATADDFMRATYVPTREPITRSHMRSSTSFTQTIQNLIQKNAKGSGINNVIRSGGDSAGSVGDDDDEESATYQMMKSQHGHGSKSKSKSKRSEFAKMEERTSFFYSGMEELEGRRRRYEHDERHHQQQQRDTTKGQNAFFDNNHDEGRYSYFNPQSRRGFIERHSLLNADILREEEERSYGSADDDNDDDNDFDDEYHLDFMNLFTFGCSPSTRDRHRHFHRRNKEDLPAISDIRKSSLSYMSNGRIQMRLPGDNVRLVMDEYLEPGILSVEMMSSPSDEENILHVKDSGVGSGLAPKSHLNLTQNESFEDFPDQLLPPSDVRKDLWEEEWNEVPRHQYRIPEPNYLLTVDQDLYKRVLTDLSDSKMPCGLYYCCHDSVDGSKHVNIGVAIGILAVVFTCLFVGVYQWPLS